MKRKLALLLSVLALAVFAFFLNVGGKSRWNVRPKAVAYLNSDQAGKKTQLNVKDVSPIQDLLNRFQLLSFNII